MLLQLLVRRDFPGHISSHEIAPEDLEAEDGVIKGKYPLKECSSSSYLQWTEWCHR